MNREHRGSGFIYRQKRKGRITSANWWIGYYLRGKLHRETSKSTEYKVARKLLKHRVAEGEMTGHIIAPVAERVTVADLIARVRTANKTNRSNSLRSVERAAKHLIEFFGEDTKAINLTSERINDYVEARSKQLVAHYAVAEGADGRPQRTKTPTPPSSATVNRELATLRHGFALMLKDHKLTPADVPAITLAPEPPARQGFVEPAEFERLCAELPESLRDAVRFLYISGWRKNAMRKLAWSDCELERDERTGKITGGMIHLRAENAKNGREWRLPLNDDLIAILNRAWSSRVPGVVNVFLRDKKPLGEFTKTWRSACKAAGLGKLRVHDLRRSCVRNLVRSGVAETVAMKISQHLTRTVFDRYNIVAVSDLEDAMTKQSRYVRERAAEKPKVVPLRRSA